MRLNISFKQREKHILKNSEKYATSQHSNSPQATAELNVIVLPLYLTYQNFSCQKSQGYVFQAPIFFCKLFSPYSQVIFKKREGGGR